MSSTNILRQTAEELYQREIDAMIADVQGQEDPPSIPSPPGGGCRPGAC